MAVINQVLHRMNSSGTYDTIYMQSNMANVTGVLAPEHGGTGVTEALGTTNSLDISEAVGVNFEAMSDVDVSHVTGVNFETMSEMGIESVTLVDIADLIH